MPDNLADTPSSSVQTAQQVVVVVSRMRRRLREEAGFGLTPSQTSVISRLSKGGPSTAAALAAAEGVRPQSMAAILGVLDEQGFLRRQPDPDDGRRVVLSLTAAGQRRIDGSRRARQDWLVRALQDRCTERERATVLAAMAVLERVAQS